MFERYTEKARRVVFFARYEASSFGSSEIDSEHMLLGLLREDHRFRQPICPEGIDLFIETIARRVTLNEVVPTSVDLPISEASKLILRYAEEAADSNALGRVETKHIFLGILRDTHSLAAKLLQERGLTLEAGRQLLAQWEREATTARIPPPLAKVRFCVSGESEPLMTHTNLTWVPSVGDTIQISRSDTERSVYTVTHISWSYFAEEDGTYLGEVNVDLGNHVLNSHK